MEKALYMVSENLHLDFSSASYTCVILGKPLNLRVLLFFLPKMKMQNFVFSY